jgi:hypothetical protein
MNQKEFVEALLGAADGDAADKLTMSRSATPVMTQSYYAMGLPLLITNMISSRAWRSLLLSSVGVFQRKII